MANVYNRGKYELAIGASNPSVNIGTDWINDDIRMLLVTSSYTYDRTHEFVDDITNELSGGGYSRQIINFGKDIVLDGTNHIVQFLGGNNGNDDSVTFSALENTAGNPSAAILYRNIDAQDNISPLLSYISLETPPVPNGGDYIINIPDDSGLIGWIQMRDE